MRGNAATGWVGGLPDGGIPEEKPLMTLPRGLEALALGTFDSNPVDARGFAQFTMVYEADVHHYTRGEVYVVADSVAAPPAVGVIWAEVQVIAITGGVPDLLAVAAVNSGSGPLKVQWGASAAYNLIQIRARQFINGAPSSAIDNNTRLDLRVFGRLYR